MADVAKDLTAGTIGGAAQLIVGHPFDTIKVKLQSLPVPPPGQLPRYSGAMDAVKQTIAAEGPWGLYKGMGAPLATVAALNAVLFTVRGQMEALLRSEPGAPLIVHIIIHFKKNMKSFLFILLKLVFSPFSQDVPNDFQIYFNQLNHPFYLII
ncbi:putative mitochondrial carrier domain superfamily [Helianthus annuus]|nr:putative mitochondrial carrier domain superfamily [Helianthus annuus]KAJ0518387.1 putative mitochondrial carrier domain superfamily [Helianthus annuus]KAJ0686419.1 putative mitochondrial carrier domain superfamily [Helianthus annuus]KAJ0690240.1 putative mitochondrial carrier domain superfamily [Helianthus annuus]KAJ0871729.1 putative mitochondrial carrier domain superfamily [Helianthus annuus]